MGNYRQIISESEQAVIDHTAEADRFTILLDNQQRVCDEEQVSYDSATASRYENFPPFDTDCNFLEIMIWIS